MNPAAGLLIMVVVSAVFVALVVLAWSAGFREGWKQGNRAPRETE